MSSPIQPPKIAYLILAHNTPRHLQRLIDALSSDAAAFFIHLDKKSDSLAFEGLKAERVYFTKKRVAVYWGDYSQVEAILILLKAALSHDVTFDRLVLLSGADYPIRSATYIERFFEEHANREFMSLVEMPCAEAGKPISRLNNYALRPGDGKIVNFLKTFLIRIHVLPRKRNCKKYFGELLPYGGSTWWAITREAGEHILNFAQNNSQIVNFFKNTASPDEAFFQTIIGNSRFKTSLSRDLTYADWSMGGPSPANISEKHITLFQSSPFVATDGLFGEGEILFARKFPDESTDLLLKLEQQNKQEQTNPNP